MEPILLTSCAHNVHKRSEETHNEVQKRPLIDRASFQLISQNHVLSLYSWLLRKFPMKSEVGFTHYSSCSLGVSLASLPIGAHI